MKNSIPNVSSVEQNGSTLPGGVMLAVFLFTFFGGMAAGLGIMLGDGLVALGAALGVNAISGAMRDYRTPIQIVGGLGLIIAGARLYWSQASLMRLSCNSPDE